MAKMHEILAVESDLRGSFQNILKETQTTFTKKTDHFLGQNRILEMFEANHPLHNSEDSQKELDTTVDAKLKYMAKFVSRYFDCVLQKEVTNQKACADLVVDGVTIAKDVPATFLLGLEDKLNQIRSVLALAPTLPPGKNWVEAPQKGENVYQLSEPEKQVRSEKIIKPFILYEATKEHPAQVEKIPESKDIGVYKRYIWSGMITPAQKSNLLWKLDQMLLATKKARRKANDETVEARQIGDKIMNYIIGS